MRINALCLLLVTVCLAASEATAQCNPGWKYGLDQGAPGLGTGGSAGGGKCIIMWDPDGAGPLSEWLVIGGGFAIAGDVFAANIVAWDGFAWHPLGDISGEVMDLAVFNGDLIAAGTISEAGGVPVKGIARFDGSAWHAMDTGLSLAGGAPGFVAALALFDGSLIAAGSFVEASGLLTNNIAGWDGAAWHALGFGVDAQVRALAVLGPNLYAGGEFITAGVVSANRVARWDGSTWSAMGSGTGAGVHALAPMADGSLAVGGSFSEAGGLVVNRLATWWPGAGGVWSNPFGSGPGGTVHTLKEVNGVLLIGGAFFAVNEIPNLAAWLPGNGLVHFGFGTNGTVHDIGMFGEKPVIVGAFDKVGPQFELLGYPTVAWGVAIFSPATCPVPNCIIPGVWERVTPGIDATVYSMGVSNGEFMAAGYPFNSAGMVNPLGIARFNGDVWRPLIGLVPPPPPAQLPGSAYGPFFAPWQGLIRTITNYQGSTIAAGQFNQPGFLSQNITSWNGSGDYWGSVFFDTFNGGQDLDANVNALTTWDPDGSGITWPLMLIAGGDFNNAGRNGPATPASKVAGFKLGSWTAFGSGVDGVVHALAVYNGELIVGGAFSTAGGVWAPCIARLTWTQGQPSVWTWSPLGTGIAGGSVQCLAVHNGSLYAGGQFSHAGGAPAVNIARWDGSNWHALGDGLGLAGSSTVSALASYMGDLYAGGAFQGSIGTGGAVLMANIGRWDGAAWNPLAGGAAGHVMALAVYEGGLMVGGSFLSVDGRVSHRWARWEPDVIAPALASGANPLHINARCVGADAAFSVTVAFGTAPSFQWRRNGVPLVNGPTPSGSVIENATTASLSIRGVTRADVGTYDCIVFNACGSGTCAAATLSVCYANCDCSTGKPRLTANDFLCYINSFATGQPYANCDESSGSPVLTANDFVCYINAYAGGCP